MSTFTTNHGANVQSGPAMFVSKSSNVKIKSAKGNGEVSTTYVSIKASCPDTCSMKADGTCYAQNGKVGMVVRRVEERSGGSASRNAAMAEAATIDAAFAGRIVPRDGARGGRDLRLHTAGDCSTPGAARVVAAAARRWQMRGGGDVWTYTHAWRSVERQEWLGVSVLASVDNVQEALEAAQQGYAPAMVVATFPSSKSWEAGGVRWIPCPAQTREDTGCADCRLCMDADKLHVRKAGIAFEAHGARAGKLKRKLEVVQ